MKGSLARYLGKDYLFPLAQYKFLTYQDHEAIVLLMTAAAQLGHEEAQWLLSLFGENPLITQPVTTYGALYRWKIKLFVGDPSVRAMGYVAFLMMNNPPSKRSYAEGAAAFGNPLAQFIMSELLIRDDNLEEGMVYLEKAIQQNFPLAMHNKIVLSSQGRIPRSDNDLRLRAATLGHPVHARALFIVNLNGGSSYKKNIFEAAKCLAKTLIADSFQSWDDLGTFLSNQLINVDHAHDKRSVIVIFTLGREFDGYAELFQSVELPVDLVLMNKILTIYRKVIARVRTAAMFTVHLFRRLLGRDVATLMAKAVYATKNEPFTWYRSQK